MELRFSNFAASVLVGVLTLGVIQGCTNQTPRTFGLKLAEQNFSGGTQAVAPVDILWMVDNSASMDHSQDKLRQGFATFAKTYLKPNWDIRMAVIPSDAYLANPVYDDYRNSKDRAGTMAVVQAHPAWTHDYAKLLPGLHDGPIPSDCSAKNTPEFYYGLPQCAIRDSSTNRGSDNCLHPGSGESAITQCVNTLNNNTIHSGKPILSTIPPKGTRADAAWTQQLIDNFMINITTGTAGSGEERGMSSVLEMLQDNETAGSATKFFRPGSLRIIVFVSDEDDQSVTYPNPVPKNYRTDYGYTYNKLDGDKCPAKTVDGYTYHLSDCVNPNDLLPVENVKAQLDSFFDGLDSGSTNPNYMIVSIVSMTGKTIQTLQENQISVQKNSGHLIPTRDQDRGDRYIRLGELVGNGSFAMDIGEEDYSPILDKIGLQVVQHYTNFTLQRAPHSAQEIAVSIVHKDGTRTAVKPNQFAVNGKNLTLTDSNLIGSLTPTDRIDIKYEPRSVY